MKHEFSIQYAGIPHGCFGFCVSCKETHNLEQGNARKHCLDLMRTLEENGRIDFEQPACDADPRLSTEYLFGEPRGQMFGMLECTNGSGQIVKLKAFSGQYNGTWEVAGWVPPLLDTKRFSQMVYTVDTKIKVLGKRIEGSPQGQEKLHLTALRKKMSRNLMKEIHALYQVHNFRSEVKSLFELFSGGIPTGAGDCCAPKLLNFAAQNQLHPLSLAEFYWGKENRSATRQHGCFYSSCESKCQPILGFLLCGAR